MPGQLIALVGTQFCASTRKNARSVMTKAAEERKKPKDFLLGGGVISFSAKPEIKASNGGLFYVRDRGGVCFLTVAPFKMNGLMKTSCLRPEKGRATVSTRVTASMIAPRRQKKSQRWIEY